MKNMSKEKSLEKQAINTFFIAMASSVIFSSLFGYLYLYFFNPSLTGGLAGWGNIAALGVIQNSIFAFLFFLPLFVTILIPRKQWLVWLFFIFVPFTMVYVGGGKHLLWFFILTIFGVSIGSLIKIIFK